MGRDWRSPRFNAHHVDAREKTTMESRDLPSGHGWDEAWGGEDEDRRARDAQFTAAYEELRRLAANVQRGLAGATLSPTELVHEAWVKLARSPSLETISELHFKRIAARAMRQVLVEAARRREASKRGGGAELVTFDDGVASLTSGSEELLALDEALQQLAQVNPRQAMMVESRFFGGLDIPETAQLLHVSEATILRDWRAARAWLAHELRP
jgi:RNA polymerase sigma-70 factor, ECF subfamily